MSKCTTSCNRASQIKKLEAIKERVDSALQAKDSINRDLERTVKEQQSKIDMLQGFTDKQNEIARQRNVVDSINAAKEKVTKQQLDNLNKEIKNLKN
jgi:hypothetical protein